MTRRSIAIIGGGIAGLTLAAALDPQRFQVTVIEAEPGRAGTGSGLVLWPAAARALRAIGAGEVVDRHARHRLAGAVRDLRTGRSRLPSGSVSLTIVPRPELLAAIEARVPPGVVRQQGLVRDPHLIEGDLVVGADGVRSQVRALVRGREAGRLTTPYLALRGLLDRPPSPETVGEYWGGGRLFGLVPLGAGGYWFTTHRSGLGPEPIDPAVALAQVRATFIGVAPVVREVLAHADPQQVLVTRIWVAPPMSRYRRGRYLVIGDAAHAMTPNLGRGAGDAIVDAVTLARALSASPDALARWQVRRLLPTQAARFASGALMRVALRDLRG